MFRGAGYSGEAGSTVIFDICCGTSLVTPSPTTIPRSSGGLAGFVTFLADPTIQPLQFQGNPGIS